MFQYLVFPFIEANPIWVAILFAILLVALYTDLKYRRIPNWLTLGGFLAMLIFLLITKDIEVLKLHGLSLLFGAILLLPLFAFRALGGGDIKLLFVICLAFSVEYLFSVFLWIFLVGGVQGVFSYFFYKRKALPYAVAISGGVFMYLVTSVWG